MAGLIPFNRRHGRLINRGFEDFYNRVDDLLNEGFAYGENLIRGNFKMDIQKKDHEYLIEAELPGVKKEEVNLELEDGRLTISVKREENINEEGKNYIHKETRSSSMSRSVYLQDAQQEGVKAKLDNGILSITIPREEKPNCTKRIDIQ